MKTSPQVVKWILFVHFLEETSAWKNHFEFVWPLIFPKYVEAYSRYCFFQKKINKYKCQIPLQKSKRRKSPYTTSFRMDLDFGLLVKWTGQLQVIFYQIIFSVAIWTMVFQKIVCTLVLNLNFPTQFKVPLWKEAMIQKSGEIQTPCLKDTMLVQIYINTYCVW